MKQKITEILTGISVAMLVLAATYLILLYCPIPELGLPLPKQEKPVNSNLWQGCSASASGNDTESVIFSASAGYLYQESLWNRSKKDEEVSHVVIQGYTVMYQNTDADEGVRIDGEWMKEKGLPVELADNFLDNNRTSIKLTKKISFGKKYSLMSRKEQNSYFKPGGKGWRGFYEQHANKVGFIAMSKPGVYKDVAIIYGSIYCGCLCGRGVFLILNRENNSWKVAKEYLYRVS